MKKIVIVMMMAVTAIVAKADLLYFMANAFDWDGPKYFDFAMVGVAKDGKTDWGDGGSQVYLQIQSSPDSSEGSSIFLAADTGDNIVDRYYATGWAEILDDYKADGYTFYVETYANDSDDPIWAYSPDTAKTYDQLKAANHVYKPGETEPQDMAAWVVPEPTSGMLVLFAMAVLALRRKRCNGILQVV